MFFNPGSRHLIPRIFFLLSILVLPHCQFIELRIYPPMPHKQFQPNPSKPHPVEWVDSTGKGARLGFHDPFIFSSRELENSYGDLVYVLKNEVEKNPKRYSRLYSGEPIRIEILAFDLETDDSCLSNQTKVYMKAKITIRGSTREFKYNDSIDSHVTDCFLVGSSLTLVPLLAYTPYVGYRGNREDQLNQLGRNALRAFLEYLHSPKSGFVKKDTTKESIEKKDVTSNKEEKEDRNEDEKRGEKE